MKLLNLIAYFGLFVSQGWGTRPWCLQSVLYLLERRYFAWLWCCVEGTMLLLPSCSIGRSLQWKWWGNTLWKSHSVKKSMWLSTCISKRSQVSCYSRCILRKRYRYYVWKILKPILYKCRIWGLRVGKGGQS